MNKILSALVLLAIVAVATSAKLLAIPQLDSVHYEKLEGRFKTMGRFLDFSLVLTQNENEEANILRRFPAHILFNSIDNSRSLAVLEQETSQSKWVEEIQTMFLKGDIKVIYATTQNVLVSYPKDLSIYDVVLPDETHIFTLSTSEKLVKPNIELLEKKHKNFVFEDRIQQIVNNVSESSLTNFALFLSGERNDSIALTRNSFSSETPVVAQWLSDQYKGYGFSPSIESFQSTYGPNVIATLRGVQEPEKVVVIGAHYDSRGPDRNSPTQRAPGANDDGSGTAVLLELARLVSELNLQFRYTVVLGSWCGEEQGLVGSRAYALKCAQGKVDVISMIQGDMLAYRKTGEAPQCAFPNRYHTPALTSLLKDVVTSYVPELQVCETSACCSDHQSFYEQGYSATQFFERCGSIADVQYHQTGDLVRRPNYDTLQLTYNARAMISSLLVLAEVI